MTNQKSSIYFLLFCLAVALAVVYFVIKPFFGPLILAAVFAFLFQSIYQRILGIIKKKEGLASFLTMIVAIVLILLPIIFLGNKIVKESQQLYHVLAGEDGSSFFPLINNLLNETRISSLVPGGFDANDLNQYLRQALSVAAQSIGGIFSSVAQMMLNLFVFLIAFYYLLKDGDKLKEYLVKLSPLKDSDDELIVSRIRLAVSSVVKGNLLIGLIQGTLTSIGLAIFGVSNPVLWGSIAVIAAMVPGIGTAVVITPAVIFLFFSGNDFGAIGLLIWGVVAVGLVDNFLGPKLVGRGMRLHPLAAFLAVIGGLAFFGPLGILLGPLALSICLALVEIYFSITKRKGVQ